MWHRRGMRKILFPIDNRLCCNAGDTLTHTHIYNGLLVSHTLAHFNRLYFSSVEL